MVRDLEVNDRMLARYWYECELVDELITKLTEVRDSQCVQKHNWEELFSLVEKLKESRS